MRNILRSPLALLILLTAVAVITVACAGGGGGGAQPTPTPTPTKAQAQPPAGGDSALIEKGKQLASQCTACHTTDGSASVGPTWKGLYGSTVELADGSTVTADEDYLRESIVNPDAKVVKGFPKGVMPKGYGNQFSDDDIAAIIAYIKSLK